MRRIRGALCISAGVLWQLTACAPDASEKPNSVQEQPQRSQTSDSVVSSEAGAELGAQLLAHIDSMRGVHGDSLIRMVPDHRLLLDTMVVVMDGEVQVRNSGGRPEWRVLLDSLRDDGSRLSSMNWAEIEGFMPAHRARIDRLLEMHRSAMDGT